MFVTFVGAMNVGSMTVNFDKVSKLNQWFSKIEIKHECFIHLPIL